MTVLAQLGDLAYSMLPSANLQVVLLESAKAAAGGALLTKWPKQGVLVLAAEMVHTASAFGIDQNQQGGCVKCLVCPTTAGWSQHTLTTTEHSGSNHGKVVERKLRCDCGTTDSSGVPTCQATINGETKTGYYHLFDLELTTETIASGQLDATEQKQADLYVAYVAWRDGIQNSVSSSAANRRLLSLESSGSSSLAKRIYQGAQPFTPPLFTKSDGTLVDGNSYFIWKENALAGVTATTPRLMYVEFDPVFKSWCYGVKLPPFKSQYGTGTGLVVYLGQKLTDHLAAHNQAQADGSSCTLESFRKFSFTDYEHAPNANFVEISIMTDWTKMSSSNVRTTGTSTILLQLMMAVWNEGPYTVLQAYAAMSPTPNNVPICDGVVTIDQLAQFARNGVQEFRFWFMKNMYLNDGIITPKTDESTCNGLATATAPPSADSGGMIPGGLISDTGLFSATYINWPALAVHKKTGAWDSSKMWVLDNCKAGSNRGGNGCWYSSTYAMEKNRFKLPKMNGPTWRRCCGDDTVLQTGMLRVSMQSLLVCSLRL